MVADARPCVKITGRGWVSPRGQRERWSFGLLARWRGSHHTPLRLMYNWSLFDKAASPDQRSAYSAGYVLD